MPIDPEFTHGAMSLIYLSREDLEAACPETGAVLAAVREGVLAHANDRAIAAPSVALQAPGQEGALYTIRGAVLDLGLAAVKSAGAFPANRNQGLPPDPGLLVLHDLATGLPRAILEGSFVTTTRTAAMTALGCLTLARTGARVLGCIGARGIAVLAARMVAESIKLDEIRIHSASPDTRRAAADNLGACAERTKPVDSWEACVDGADVVIDGPGLTSHQALLPSRALSPGTTLVSYGAYSSYDSDILEHVDRIVMDRWAEGSGGPLGPFIANGQFSETSVDAWFGDVLEGRARARTDPDQRVLLWHRGLGVCDITLAAMLMERAQQAGLGTVLPYP